jgi:hypothetical protein
VAWRPASAEPWRERPIMVFRQASATDAWIGRKAPSLHNTSAPDIRFTAFRSGDAAD